MNRPKFFVLGAPDPEMETIENLIIKKGWGNRYGLAMINGQRVHSGNAYEATEPVHNEFQMVCIECGIKGLRDAITIDHHRPGDPGFGRPPAEYWEASSLGQFCHLTGIEPTPELRLVAAADHCLAAAYRGECPEVDPGRLAEWRIETKAKFKRVDPEIIRDDIEQAKMYLQKAPIIIVENTRVADMRTFPVINELPEAAAMTNTPFIAQIKAKGGMPKIVIQAAPPDAIKAFIQKWGPKEGLTKIYGDPERGFAGGYIIG